MSFLPFAQSSQKFYIFKLLNMHSIILGGKDGLDHLLPVELIRFDPSNL